MTETAMAALRGRRILVAEDEYMIAQEIDETLSDAGAETLGPVSSVGEALHLIGSQRRIDGALLDVNLRNEPIWPVVTALLQRNVPIVLTTGYDASVIPRSYVHLPRCEKPTTPRNLARALTHALGSDPAP